MSFRTKWQIGRAPVRLLARNNPILWSCAECEAPPTKVCAYCVDGDTFVFCEAHAECHEHADEKPYLPVVNSPPMGVRGYTRWPQRE